MARNSYVGSALTPELRWLAEQLRTLNYLSIAADLTPFKITHKLRDSVHCPEGGLCPDYHIGLPLDPMRETVDSAAT